MKMRLRVVFATTSISLFTVLLSGCGIAASNTATTSGTFHVNGLLHGGQQPVSGSTIQLYAANAITNAGAATPLLTKTVTSDENGSFSITGDYNCPVTNPLVYIVATGGNPGIPTSGSPINNSKLAMMSLLGTCNDLLAAGDSEFIFINEFSTIASVQFIASFMTGYANVGSAPDNPNALAGAFQSYTDEVDVTTGQYRSAKEVLPGTALQVNTLANIIASCVNTDGSGTPCSTLLSDTSSTDTVSAALHMVQSPGTNTADLYTLITPTAPFQPYFTSVPSDFTTIIGYTLPPNTLTAVAGALDSNGQIWLYTQGYTYDTVTNTSTDVPGLITVYDNNFNPTFTVSPGTGGLYYPTSLVADAHGHVFATNSNNTISEFASDGSAISPPAGWSSGIASTFTPTSPGNGIGYVNDPQDISPIVIDASGSIFGGMQASSTNCYFEMSSAGTVDTPAGNICSSIGSTSFLSNLTSDGAGNLWLEGLTAIAKADTSGNLAVTAPISQGCFYPLQNASGSSSTDVDAESVTFALAYDHVHGQLWGRSFTGVGAITDAGVAVFCDYGPAMPALPVYSTTSTTPGDPYSAGSALLINGVLDGAGNYFFITGAIASSGVVGNSPGTVTGTATYSTYLGEISPSGTVLTPYNPTTKVYGLQPSGVGLNATATSTDGVLSPTANESVALLGVDKFGNIWAADLLNNHIFKITGLATANTVNY